MRAQWKGALTFSRTALPLSAATSSLTRAMAPAVPAMTICPGALKFAGEHTNSFYEWQGFMEGACLSGIAAANAVLDDIQAGRI